MKIGEVSHIKLQDLCWKFMGYMEKSIYSFIN